MEYKFEAKKQTNSSDSTILFGNFLTFVFGATDDFENNEQVNELLSKCQKVFDLHKDKLPSEYEIEFKNPDEYRHLSDKTAKNKGTVVFDVNGCKQINASKLINFCTELLKYIHTSITGEVIDKPSRKFSNLRDVFWHIDAKYACENVQNTLSQICSPCTGIRVRLDKNHTPKEPEFCSLF